MDVAPHVANAQSERGAGGAERLRRAVVLGGAGTVGLALLVAGVVLWLSRGQVVFVDMLAGALALCF